MSTKVKYWVACSGGVDSVALVHLFHELKKSFGILHCNFQLREEESERDEAFVTTLSEQLNVPLRVKRFDTEKYKEENNVNTQLAARDLRYDWFREVIAREKVHVCLAHHKDDQIETFLLQLRRGGKIKGLSAMPYSKNGFLRPLLKYSKSDLITICRKYNWKWREDASNSSNDYKRNFYRNELIPLLEKKIIRDIDSLVDDFQILLSVLDRLKWGVQNDYRATEFFEETWAQYPAWIKQYIISSHKLGKFPVQEIDKLIEASTGAHFTSGENSVWKVKDKIAFVPAVKTSMRLQTEVILRENNEFEKGKLYIDADKVKGEIVLRSWKEGEKFQPLGMKGKKKISNYLKDRGIPFYARNNAQVLVDESDKVLGVAGMIVDERYSVSSETKKVLSCFFDKLC